MQEEDNSFRLVSDPLPFPLPAIHAWYNGKVAIKSVHKGKDGLFVLCRIYGKLSWTHFHDLLDGQLLKVLANMMGDTTFRWHKKLNKLLKERLEEEPNYTSFELEESRIPNGETITEWQNPHVRMFQKKSDPDIQVACKINGNFDYLPVRTLPLHHLKIVVQAVGYDPTFPWKEQLAEIMVSHPNYDD